MMRPRKQQNPKSGFGSWLLPTAIAGMTATVMMVAPARSAVLNQWAYDTSTRQLTLTLPQGITPDFFLLAQPARIVLDVPGTTLGAIPQEQQYSGAIRLIRWSEVATGARVVIELAPNTRLDPRHAELTATDLGNGQTRWTLRPLIQDVGTAPVATTPATPPAAISPSPAAAPPVLPAAPPPPAAPDPDSDFPTTDTAEAEAAPSPADIAEVPDTTEEPEAIEETAEAEVGVPLVVTPATEALPTPAEPVLPSLARSATTGAVQALPTGPDPLRGVSTDASALAGVGAEAGSDVPPEQLPLDPFAATAQPSVSVPSLAAADSTPSPVVSVPSLATMPAAPTTTPAAPPSAPSQARPPSPAAIATAPPAPAAPDASPAAPIDLTAPFPPPPSAPVVASRPVPPPVAAPPSSAPRSPGATAANQIRPPSAGAIAPPAVRVAPSSPPAVASAANQIRPPSVAPTARTPAPPAPSAGTAIAANQIRPPSGVPTARTPAPLSPSAGTAIAANQIRPPSVAPTVRTPAPPSPSAGTAIAANQIRPPTSASPTPFLPIVPSSTLGALPAPPFLEGTGSPPRIEIPVIPPPPNPRDNGTLPFGAPLPTTRAQGANDIYGTTLAVPVGTRVALQYEGDAPLRLAAQDPVYEILRVTADVYHPTTGERLVPAGAEILGRFEVAEDSGSRFVTQMVIDGNARVPLLAQSDQLVATPLSDPEASLAASVGAAAATIVTGFSGLGWVGGTAIAAATSLVPDPEIASVAPGQLIEVAVVKEVVAFNTPDRDQPYQ
ncbi:MAG TPA: AMIN domain-containing protein [Candidatus Obscuribacterales bacterium]